MQLKELRKSRPVLSRSSRERRIELEQRMREIRNDNHINRANLVLKDSRRCIFSLDELLPFVSKAHQQGLREELWRQSKWRQADMDDWLLKWLGVKVKQSRSKEENNHFSIGEEFREFFRANGNIDDRDDDDPPFLPKASTPSKLCEMDNVDHPSPSKLQRNLESRNVMSDAEEERLKTFPRVEYSERWRLYRLWLQRLEESNLRRIQKAQPEYEKTLSAHQAVLETQDYSILAKAQIIGMTTTCAARNRKVLQKLSPKIILIEEAAEVLEAHVVTSLVESCEHVILIGDHQQLRPRVNEFKLAKDFKFDVSLFERMVQKGIQCERLSVQHRMRPEIATLMKHVYEGLENHESVSRFKKVRGLQRNMFFIDHRQPEEQEEEGRSHTNLHEARFLVSLCRYLLLQDYAPSQITMLTPYTGQMFALREEAEKHEIGLDVRISTIDNFQGEESDIVLISLVRSNDSGKAGFMAVSNRACVALSRARLGLYCIGNFDLFRRHEIWRRIVQDLEETNSIGSKLSLVCQNHQNVREVETGEDFAAQAPNGGCASLCDANLECGHTCKEKCHPFDLEHERIQCREPCARPIRGCTHKCDRQCFQQCETYCSEMVTKELPCGHKQDMHCGKPREKVRCKEQCEDKLDCGHQCQAKCGEPCTRHCMELVKKEDWSCGHTSTAACSATQANCKVPCGAILECGHPCTGTCGECRQGRVHKACKVKCKRLLICSHECGRNCNDCGPCTRPCDSCCIHQDCKERCGQPCRPCKKPCEWRCKHFSCSKLCSEMCDRPRCDEPCRKKLRCGHVCRGLCGESCVCATCDTNNGSPITKVFFGRENEDGALFIKLPDCDHIVAVDDLDE